MNIFEFMGLPADHRASANKVTQFVKHYDEVVAKHKNKVFAGQVKKDGVCALTVIMDGAVQIFSRTGKLFTNTNVLVSRIEGLKLPDGVYMGELWVPKTICSLEQLSGIVSPNRVKPLSEANCSIPYVMRMSFFDLISLHSFRKGHSDTHFTRRHRNLWERVETSIGDKHLIEVLDYYQLDNEEDINAFFSGQIMYGEEGIVIRDPDADWEAGHKGWRVMKKVRGVDYDLKCIGFEEGTGKYKGLVANLIFRWKGRKTIKCMLGKGWTHEDAREMYQYCTYGQSVGMPEHTHKCSPIGKIFQVYALEESSKGKLRLPKVGECRFDKDYADV